MARGSATLDAARGALSVWTRPALAPRAPKDWRRCRGRARALELIIRTVPQAVRPGLICACTVAELYCGWLSPHVGPGG